MEERAILELLNNVKKDKMEVSEAMDKLKNLPFQDLGFVKIDNHRSIRNGFPEVIYGEGKTPEQVAIIVGKMEENYSNILVTRSNEEQYLAIIENIDRKKVEHNKISKTIIINKKEGKKSKFNIVVATGGTSDMSVAEEAAVTVEAFGCNVTRLYDVGVAGIHRLLSNKEILFNANVIIAVAGMEGALPSVIGGLVDCPVIAVPTSVGYGANLGGMTTLLAMLNSCASGISVVNIDNGFGAGYSASTIIRQLEKGAKDE